jgi:hypothetical protein
LSYITKIQLDLDLTVLTNHCYTVAPVLKQNWGDVEQISFLHPAYNFLCFPNKQLHKLYFHLHETFNKIKKYNDLYYITMWFNMHKVGEYIDWHSHNPPEDNAYHGYFSVNAEPSVTSFKMPDGLIDDVINKNNQLVIVESNDNMHSVSPWNGEGDRITIAFDIIPSKLAFGNTMFENKTNKWIPI